MRTGTLVLLLATLTLFPGAPPRAQDPPPPPPCDCDGDGAADTPIHPILRFSQPQLIADSRVAPKYPRRAKRARVESEVVLQCVIRKDGTVGPIEVLRVSRPGYGFEEAAIKAVSRWRYVPATRNREPVDTYFMVVIAFQMGDKEKAEVETNEGPHGNAPVPPGGPDGPPQPNGSADQDPDR